MGLELKLVLTEICIWGELSSARKVFDDMPERDDMPWNAMIGVFF